MLIAERTVKTHIVIAENIRITCAFLKWNNVVMVIMTITDATVFAIVKSGDGVVSPSMNLSVASIVPKFPEKMNAFAIPENSRIANRNEIRV